MCAGAGGKIRGKKVNIYMGYYGGSFSIGDVAYDVNGGEGYVSEIDC